MEGQMSCNLTNITWCFQLRCFEVSSLNYQILIKNKKKKTLINAPVNHYGSMVILLSMFLGMSTDFNLPSSIKLNVL